MFNTGEPVSARESWPHARPRVVALVDGDPWANPMTHAKFEPMLVALADQVELVGVGNGRLHGGIRLLNAVLSWMPDRRAWHQHFRKNPLSFRLRSWQIDRWLRSRAGQFDVVFQNGALFQPWWRLPCYPYVLYLDFTHALTAREWPQRSPMSSRERQRWLKLEQDLYFGAQTIFVRSHYVQRSLEADYSVAPERIQVVGAGVNVPIPPLRERAGPPHVLFIGKDHERKGGDVLLAAWTRVYEAVPEARLTYVGDPRGAVPPGVDVLAKWDRARVLALLSEASIFTMPSRCETWGDVFLEAMAYGLPCIGTTADAMPEIIVHEETGLLVPPGDADALADALLRLVRDPSLVCAYGKAGRQRLLKRFTWDYVIGLMLPALVAVTQQGRAGRSSPAKS